MAKNKLDEMKNPVLEFLNNGSMSNSNSGNSVESLDTRISVLTTETIKRDLKKVAKVKDKSINELINIILKDYLSEDENKRIILKFDSIQNL